MPLAVTSSALIAASPQSGTGFFRRILTAIINARVAEAERIVTQMMQRRGFQRVDGHWIADPVGDESCQRR